jgi:hypothetical protein
VRQKLQPLGALAGRRKIAVMAVKHLNKNEGASVENRIGGSIGYVGIARSILLFGHDNRKEFTPGHTYGGVKVIKGNLSQGCSPVAYEINSRGFTWLGTDEDITEEVLLPKPRTRNRES